MWQLNMCMGVLNMVKSLYVTVMLTAVSHLVFVSALKSVNLTVPGLTADDWNNIDGARLRLLTNVTDFVYIGPNEYDSSTTSGSSTDATDDTDDDDDDPFPDMIIHGNNIEIHVSDDEDDLFEPPPRYNGDVNNNDDDFFM